MSANISRRTALRTTVVSATGAAALLSVLGGALVPAAFGQQAPAQSNDSGSPTLSLHVFPSEQGIKGPDGLAHDAFVPSSFVLQSGVPTTVSVINHDEGQHTITSLDLGLNLMINPATNVGGQVQPVTTSATMTVSQPGVYRWFCAIGCDDGSGSWAMSDSYDGKDQNGFMAGNIVVL